LNRRLGARALVGQSGSSSLLACGGFVSHDERQRPQRHAVASPSRGWHLRAAPRPACPRVSRSHGAVALSPTDRSCQRPGRPNRNGHGYRAPDQLVVAAPHHFAGDRQPPETYPRRSEAQRALDPTSRRTSVNSLARLYAPRHSVAGVEAGSRPSRSPLPSQPPHGVALEARWRPLRWCTALKERVARPIPGPCASRSLPPASP
jgi:hypothetical protein